MVSEGHPHSDKPEFCPPSCASSSDAVSVPSAPRSSRSHATRYDDITLLIESTSFTLSLMQEPARPISFPSSWSPHYLRPTRPSFCERSSCFFVPSATKDRGPLNPAPNGPVVLIHGFRVRSSSRFLHSPAAIASCSPNLLRQPLWER